jgi:hypothetical protein
LDRCRVFHGEWNRCLNNHYGGQGTAVFLDPPYKGFEHLYPGSKKMAEDVEEWCREHSDIKIALCGHLGDYDLPGWSVGRWKRRGLTYSGSETTDLEAVWFSPSCIHQEND